MSTPLSRIRNFSIVAHIDHGKSTLADRLIQLTGTVAERDMKEQMLDAMDIERERGITIKANTVRIDYPAQDGHTYMLNLIDTPGHVDFAYEVSRSMRAVEGSLLVVDATQGVEAQTLANVYTAIDADHEIVPVLNKVDLPAAEPDRVREQIEDVIGIEARTRSRSRPRPGSASPTCWRPSCIPACPRAGGDPDAPSRRCWWTAGTTPISVCRVLVRIMDGTLRKGDQIRMMQTGARHGVDTLAVLRPAMTDVKALGPGEIGHLHRLHQAGARHPRRRHDHPREEGGRDSPAGLQALRPGGVLRALSGRQRNEFEDLRTAIEKLALNDASFTYEMETSAALGFGFRCGFPRPAASGGGARPDRTGIRHRADHHRALGRLSRAHEATATMRELHNPADMPDPPSSTMSRSRASRRRSWCPTSSSATC